MRTPLVALLVLTACRTLPAQDVVSTLTSLRVGDREWPFGAPVSIEVRTSPPLELQWYERQTQVRLRVVAIGGVELPATAEVVVRTSREQLGELAADRRCRLTGRIGDALDFGGATAFSFATERVEDLAAAAPLAAAEEPVDLEAAAGGVVGLDGRLWSMNGVWWLDAGREVYLTDGRGRRRTFPTHWHGHRVTARGRLEWQRRLPLREGGALIRYPVVFDAQVTLAHGDDARAEANDDARFRQLHERSPQLVGGVFELLPEAEVRKNHMGYETAALLWAGRNWPYLQHTLADGSPRCRDELARRVQDAELPGALRALYAGALAAHDDARGRAYLREALRNPEDVDRDALYVLGAFWKWRAGADCDVAWSEDLALACLRDAPRDACVYGDVPGLLARIGTAECAAELLRAYEDPPADDPFSFSDPRASLRHALLALPDERLTTAMLLRMADATPDPDRNRRAICSALLARDEVEADDRFLPQITESFWDDEFHEHAGPRVLAAIEARLPELDGAVRAAAERLLRRRAPNARELALQRLVAEHTPPEELAELCWDLDHPDPGAGPEVVRVLRERLLVDDPKLGVTAFSILSMLKFVGRSDEPASVAAMVALLDADFSPRATEFVSTGQYRQQVAGQLAEMTGRSFGTDAAAWRAWLERR